MVLALCAILVVSPERRKIVAVAALGLAALASGAILVEQWHYPSDVLGGYAVAGAWTFGAAALIMPRVRPRESTAAPRRRWLRATG
jgi:membrane-associated phospholipid phosphatase